VNVHQDIRPPSRNWRTEFPGIKVKYLFWLNFGISRKGLEKFKLIFGRVFGMHLQMQCSVCSKLKDRGGESERMKRSKGQRRGRVRGDEGYVKDG
jgi:hypothetical protein